MSELLRQLNSQMWLASSSTVAAHNRLVELRHALRTTGFSGTADVLDSIIAPIATTMTAQAKMEKLVKEEIKHAKA
jgi:hypothetical protein